MQVMCPHCGESHEANPPNYPPCPSCGKRWDEKASPGKKTQKQRAAGSQQPGDYSLAIAAGTLYLCKQLSALEKKHGNADRAERKRAVVERKIAMMKEAFPGETEGIADKELPTALLPTGWPRDRSTSYLIDLAFSNPFAPYELKVKDKHFDEGLRNVAARMDKKLGTVVDDIQKTRKDALKAHKHIAWGKVALWGVGGLAVLGVGGWLAAPVIGAYLGAGAGLAGAAATSHGLALLGGGSLALGGAGMAGGMWVVTSAGIVLGGATFGGGAVLLQIGAAQARVELVKLQVNYKLTVLATQTQLKKAQEVIVNLAKERDYVAKQLNEERLLNDKNSKRLKEMEDTLLAMEDALAWMKKAS